MKISHWIIPGLELTNQKKHDLMIKTICNFYLVSEEELKTTSRVANIIKAKKAICYYLNQHFKIPQQTIEKRYNLGIKRLAIRSHVVTYKNSLEIRDKEVLKLHEIIKKFL
ncbi:MAG: hypothetical protein QXL18_05095 [Candidatus Woesearchaeota archaeon]